MYYLLGFNIDKSELSSEWNNKISENTMVEPPDLSPKF